LYAEVNPIRHCEARPKVQTRSQPFLDQSCWCDILRVRLKLKDTRISEQI
jgi:hypothetical protein